MTSNSPEQERSWALVCHILSFAGLIIPFGNVLAPLIWWLIKKDESEWVMDQGKEVLNWQITISIGYLICIPLTFVIIGGFLGFCLIVLNIVFTILAIVSVNQGKKYQYPFSLKLIV